MSGGFASLFLCCQLFLVLVDQSFGCRWFVASKDAAQLQPSFCHRFIPPGNSVGFRVRFIRHPDLPAPLPSEDSAGVPPGHLHRSGSCLGRPAAGVHGALCVVAHPQPEFSGGVSASQLLFNRDMQRRTRHRKVPAPVAHRPIIRTRIVFCLAVRLTLCEEFIEPPVPDVVFHDWVYLINRIGRLLFLIVFKRSLHTGDDSPATPHL